MTNGTKKTAVQFNEKISRSSAIENAAKKWYMPLRDWKPAINQFMIMYQDRIPDFN
jgi:transposase-like protein